MPTVEWKHKYHHDQETGKHKLKPPGPHGSLQGRKAHASTNCITKYVESMRTLDLVPKRLHSAWR